MSICRESTILFATLALLLAAPTVSAQILGGGDQFGSVVINEDTGIPGFCDIPCFIVEKDFEVYLPGNPSAPGVCAAGEVTYLYTITHIGGSNTPYPFIPAVTEFEIGVTDATTVSAAGFVPGDLEVLLLAVSPSSHQPIRALGAAPIRFPPGQRRRVGSMTSESLGESCRLVLDQV